MNDRDHCKKCIYCDIQEDGAGYCRRDPPVVIQSVRLNVLSKQPEAILVSVFPQCPGDWRGCGEFEGGFDVARSGGANDEN